MSKTSTVPLTPFAKALRDAILGYSDDKSQVGTRFTLKHKRESTSDQEDAA